MFDLTPPHEPLPYCDCGACTLVERNRLREEVQRLQRALSFWHPRVPPGDGPFFDRAASDAWLLTGFEGPDEPSAESLGWIHIMVQAPPNDRTAKIARLMYWEDAEDCWTLAPDLVESIIDVDQFPHDGDEISISFRRMDLSEDEIDAMPQV